MRTYPVKSICWPCPQTFARRQLTRCLVVLWCGCSISAMRAQSSHPTQENPADKIQRLTQAIAQTQQQLEQTQRQLEQMRLEVETLRHEVATGQPTPAAASPGMSAATSAAGFEEVREQQAVEEAQIATHEQTKVETMSKYPLKITGLVLLNGFVNTSQVDSGTTPTIATPGAGSTGASLRQTILGFDARGPHLLGAVSYADLSVDFDGSSQSSASTSSYLGYSNSNLTLLRLRTAHAGLQWPHAAAYFAQDRPIVSPDSPASLTAVAVPELAWSGNLWTWNPQLVVTRDLGRDNGPALRLQGALVDAGDAPLSSTASSANTAGAPPSGAEQSRWPGAEARIALLGPVSDERTAVGFGGYFAPHLTPFGDRFDAWAGTLDAHWNLPMHLGFSAAFYRGVALGGLGGGAYKDFVYRVTSTGRYYYRPLDDTGGWAQLKEKFSERMEVNAAFGLDNAFSRELRRYAVAGGSMAQNLARNRTFEGNVIYRPSAYLLFSLEYRRLESFPVSGARADTNVIGIAAGYKF